MWLNWPSRKEVTYSDLCSSRRYETVTWDVMISISAKVTLWLKNWAMIKCTVLLLLLYVGKLLVMNKCLLLHCKKSISILNSCFCLLLNSKSPNYTLKKVKNYRLREIWRSDFNAKHICSTCYQETGLWELKNRQKWRDERYFCRVFMYYCHA